MFKKNYLVAVSKVVRQMVQNHWEGMGTAGWNLAVGNRADAAWTSGVYSQGAGWGVSGWKLTKRKHQV